MISEKFFRSPFPPRDFLCAGFPCQPFSKAGSQQSLKCLQWGGLFDNVLGILREHLPKYLILENAEAAIAIIATRAKAKATK